MTPALTFLPASFLLAQTSGEPSGFVGLTSVFVVLAVTAGVFAAVVMQRLSAAQRRIKALTVEHKSTAEAHRALLDKERKEAKDLDARRDDVRDLKRELQNQKKKNHEIQEEMKKLRDELRQAKEETQRARITRPAFDEPAKVVEKPRAEPSVAVAVAPAVEPTAKPATPPIERQPEASPVVANAARADAKVTELEQKLAARQAELDAVHTARLEANAELRQLRKRVESLRRIDLISTSKVEILEDKLAQLGRDHYDTISQLALLKGDVQPVPPPQPRRARSRSAEPIDDADRSASETDDAREPLAAVADTGDPTPEALAPAESNDNAIEQTS